VKLSVTSQGRFFEPDLRVKQAIDEGRIGRPVLATLILWIDESFRYWANV
jgi:predicted dehydrogenase